MRIVIVGAGPAGLYLAYLLKRARAEWRIDVIEQNAVDATFGFGIAFSEHALEILEAEDAQTLDAIAPTLEFWSDSVLSLDGAEVRIDGIGYSGISRLKLLQILQARAAAVGVVPKYGRRIERLEELGPADLVAGADGANSAVRRAREREFGTTVSLLANRFAWFGTRKHFPALGHSFVHSPIGAFNAHHHPHAPDMSTFVVEVGEDTFYRRGLDRKDADQSRAICEFIFEDTLSGEDLISNNSIWRRFPRITNRHWSAGNVVLLGDALHTIHYSIGSGTRLAMEDAIALARALVFHAPDVEAALAAYEAQRRPEVDKLLAAAEASAQWYEDFASHMRAPPLEFAMSYITRSGRVDLERLKHTSADFVARYEAFRRSTQGSGA
jgi:2-polyprenyl-6-methoxyphenol hydroxylase-like FAD-dependent oxidoreductase